MLPCISIFAASASEVKYYDGHSIIYVNSKPAWCIHYGKSTGSSSAIEAYSYWTDKISATKQADIKRVLACANTLGYDNKSTSDFKDKYFAVQRRIWDIQYGSGYAVGSTTKEHTKTYYGYIKSLEAKLKVGKPSFSANEKKMSPVISNGSITSYKTTLKDSNNLLSYKIPGTSKYLWNIDKDKTDSSLSVSIDRTNNKINVSCKSYLSSKKKVYLKCSAPSVNITKSHVYKVYRQEVVLQGTTSSVSTSFSVHTSENVMGGVKIYKVDDLGKPLSGVTYALSSSDGEYVNDTKTTTLTSDGKSAIAYWPYLDVYDDNEKLITYTITEQSKDGYTPLSGKKTVSFTLNGYINKVRIVSNNSSNNWINTIKRGDIRVQKFTEKENADGTLGAFSKTNEPFEFRLYGSSYLGQKVDVKSQISEDGFAYFCNVPQGEYTVSEMLNSNRYICKTNNQSIRVYWDGNTVYQNTNISTSSSDFSEKINKDSNGNTTYTNTLDFYNITKKWNIKICKKDLDTGKSEGKGDASLKGAKYELHRVLNDVDSVVGVYETDIKGEFTTKYYSGLGQYYFKEVSPPKGYLLNDSIYELKSQTSFENLEKEFNTISKIYVDNQSFKYVFDTVIKGKIIVYKVDEKGNKLTGAKIGLFRKGEKDFTRDNAITVKTSNEDGICTFSSIPYGEYVIKEIKSPDGYEMDNKTYEVSIDEDGKEIELEIVNEKTTKEKMVKKKTPKSPKTGVKLFDVSFWISLVSLSIVSCLILIRRRCRDER